MWWPWKRKAGTDPPPTWERRLADLEHEGRLLKGEWLDTLERLERLAGRLAKRAERGEASALAAPAAAPAPPPVSRAMEQVLKRRAHRLNGGPATDPEAS